MFLAAVPTDLQPRIACIPASRLLIATLKSSCGLRRYEAEKAAI